MAFPYCVYLPYAVRLLHDFNTVIHLSPECSGFRAVQYPHHASDPANETESQIQYYEVEDTLHFLPKYLWRGAVKYTADFLPTMDGCNVTVRAPGGFTSLTKWRVMRMVSSDGVELGLQAAGKEDFMSGVRNEDWAVHIVSEATCSLTYSSFVKGFLKDSHQKLLEGYLAKLKEVLDASVE
jgi:hypothetical protein